MFFCFNCEKGGHLEFECPHLKIESDEIENPNEIEDNSNIKREKNHEVKYNQRERELEE
jgi:hypothetical protein